MGWHIVKQPNGLLARFSEVVDDFTDCDMTPEEAVDLCRVYMGRTKAEAKVLSGINDEPAPWDKPSQDGLSRFRYAIEVIREIHGEEVAQERIKTLST